jgi:GNAT superfamily N-acetyltransferase
MHRYYAMNDWLDTKDNDLARKMERNYITQFRQLSGINGTVFSEDEVIAEFVSGYSTSWMNGVFRIDGNLPDLKERVGETLKKYTIDCPMIWHIGVLTSQPQTVKQALLTNGLKFLDNDPGMILQTSNLKNSPPLPGFRVETVDTVEKINDWLIPFAEGFAVSQPVIAHFRQFMQMRLRQSAEEGWFIGYQDDLPVTSAYYLTDNQVTVLYGVATLSDFRKRGFARRTVESAISHACERSPFPVTLYASQMGLPLYRSMGFVDVYNLEKYVYPSD